jgi:hypothetical protein
MPPAVGFKSASGPCGEFMQGTALRGLGFLSRVDACMGFAAWSGRVKYGIPKAGELGLKLENFDNSSSFRHDADG